MRRGTSGSPNVTFVPFLSVTVVGRATSHPIYLGEREAPAALEHCPTVPVPGMNKDCAASVFPRNKAFCPLTCGEFGVKCHADLAVHRSGLAGVGFGRCRFDVVGANHRRSHH